MPSVGVVGGGREARWHDILHERWVRAIALVCVSISLIYDQKSLDKAFDAHWLLPWSQSHLNKLLTCGMSYEVWKHGLSVWSARARALSLSLSLSLPPSLPPSLPLPPQFSLRLVLAITACHRAAPCGPPRIDSLS